MHLWCFLHSGDLLFNRLGDLLIGFGRRLGVVLASTVLLLVLLASLSLKQHSGVLVTIFDSPSTAAWLSGSLDGDSSDSCLVSGAFSGSAEFVVGVSIGAVFLFFPFFAVSAPLGVACFSACSGSAVEMLVDVGTGTGFSFGSSFFF